MFSTKERLNNVGVVAGTLLAVIPLYYIIHYFSSFGVLKKTKFFVLSIFNLVAGALYFLTVIIFFIIFSVTVYNAVYDYGYYEINYVLMDMLGVVLFMLFMMLTAVVLAIVTGLFTYNFLKSEDSNFLTNDERFTLAKFAGINLTFIPLYYLIKLGIELNLIKSIDAGKSGLIIAFYILFGCSILLGWVPVLGSFIQIGLFAITIVLGVQLNSLKETIIAKENEEYKDNHDNLVSF